MILLGWKIGSGERVEIPETGHLAWFGQTQLSGKTTALEAIAFRGELKAVAFITKQGEGGFLTGRMIPPYFSEPTNDEEQPLWRWVKSILEAGQQRRMNFEESWIIRACEDPRIARTLAEVHQNIKDLIAGEKEPAPVRNLKSGKRAHGSKRAWVRKPVTGINAGVYTSLKAYFDIVMPQLARLPYTKKLVLGPGLNVMDLREYAMETQALVIRSVMEWVYQHEKNVRVIVPEAQDFVPQGKNSPVKMACETLVRKAGANKNFMWLDSQDMAAVDKIMLRACSIVGIGVQTEGHEIDRSLASLFTPALKAVDIARLRIGEFFVRTPEAKVVKCYVQPAWMESELHAQAIAKGEESVASARQMLRAFKDRQRDSAFPPPQLLQVQIQEPPDVEESESVSSVDGETAESDQSENRIDRSGDTDGHVGAEADSGAVRGSGGHSGSETSTAQGSPLSVRLADEEEQNPSFPQNLNQQEPGKHEDQSEHEAPGKGRSCGKENPGDPSIAGSDARTASAVQEPPIHAPVPAPPSSLSTNHESPVTSHQSPVTSGNGLRFTVPDLDYIYKYVAARAEKDPQVLRVLTSRPEIQVHVTAKTLEVDQSEPTGAIALLIHEKFFDGEGKNGNAVCKELIDRRKLGFARRTLYDNLETVARMGFLVHEGKLYRATGRKVTVARGA